MNRWVCKFPKPYAISCTEMGQDGKGVFKGVLVGGVGGEEGDGGRSGSILVNSFEEPEHCDHAAMISL